MIVRRQYRGGYQLAGLSELARQLRKKQTSAEALLWQLLRNRQLLGFKFRRQHQFGDHVADFYCREAQLVIECDGSVHEPNTQWDHDQNRDAYMIAQGREDTTFANDRILNATEEVLEGNCDVSRFSDWKRRGGRGGLSVRPSPRPSPCTARRDG